MPIKQMKNMLRLLLALFACNLFSVVCQDIIDIVDDGHRSSSLTPIDQSAVSNISDCNFIINALKHRIYQLQDNVLLLQSHLNSLKSINEYYNTTAHDDDYIILKVPIVKNRRSKRFLGAILSTVSGFLRRSGIMSAFKITCSEFLGFVGKTVMGEIFEKFSKSNCSSGRCRRAAEASPILISDTDFNDGKIIDCHCANEVSSRNEELSRHVHINRVIPGNISGIINIRANVDEKTDAWNDFSVRRTAYLASITNEPYISQNWGRGKNRDVCYLDEAVCIIPLGIKAITHGTLSGCGYQASLMVNLVYGYFNISGQRELDGCMKLHKIKVPLRMGSEIQNIYEPYSFPTDDMFYWIRRHVNFMDNRRIIFLTAYGRKLTLLLKSFDVDNYLP